MERSSAQSLLLRYGRDGHAEYDLISFKVFYHKTIQVLKTASLCFSTLHFINPFLHDIYILYSHSVYIYQFQPLDEANLADLKVALKGFLQKGETIKLETKVLCKCIRNMEMSMLQLVLLHHDKSLFLV